MPSKLPIGGLKCSHQLIQLNMAADTWPPIVAMLDRLADCRINLAYVTVAAQGNRVLGACAVADDTWRDVEPLVSDGTVTVVPITPVGTLTLYPHRWRPDLMRRVSSALVRAGLPIYSIASSLAALTVATDYQRLASAISAISGIAQLPENHAPFTTPWRIEQL